MESPGVSVSQDLRKSFQEYFQLLNCSEVNKSRCHAMILFRWIFFTSCCFQHFVLGKAHLINFKSRLCCFEDQIAHIKSFYKVLIWNIQAKIYLKESTVAMRFIQTINSHGFVMLTFKRRYTSWYCNKYLFQGFLIEVAQRLQHRHHQVILTVWSSKLNKLYKWQHFISLLKRLYKGWILCIDQDQAVPS